MSNCPRSSPPATAVPCTSSRCPRASRRPPSVPRASVRTSTFSSETALPADTRSTRSPCCAICPTYAPSSRKDSPRSRTAALRPPRGVLLRQLNDLVEQGRRERRAPQLLADVGEEIAPLLFLGVAQIVGRLRRLHPRVGLSVEVANR